MPHRGVHIEATDGEIRVGGKTYFMRVKRISKTGSVYLWVSQLTRLEGVTK